MSTSDTLQVQAVLQSWHVLLYARQAYATTWGRLLQVLVGMTCGQQLYKQACVHHPLVPAAGASDATVLVRASALLAASRQCAGEDAGHPHDVHLWEQAASGPQGTQVVRGHLC